MSSTAKSKRSNANSATAPRVHKTTLEAAESRFLELAGRSFADLVDEAALRRIPANKGGAGQLIETLLGVQSGPQKLDFVDGELKTYHCDPDGFPIETIAICRADDIDDMLMLPPFASSRAYAKLRRVLFVGVWRPDSDPGAWRIPIAFRLDARPGTEWFSRLEASYQTVLKQLHKRLVDGDNFTTMNGPLLQMRVRDSRPYSPVFSRRLNREVSNKRLGFYLKKRFITECVTEARA